MAEISPEFIERYQIMYDRDPKSKVFAPLAEAYRQMGLTNKALLICKEGLQHNPNFAGGHIALSKALIDLDEPQKAIEHLDRATELSPENILAYHLLAETHLRQKEYRESLRAYKMFLFLSPENKKAQKAVSKLEKLLSEDFMPTPEGTGAKVWSKMGPKSPKNIDGQLVDKTSKLKQASTEDRYISLSDAHIARGDFPKALDAIEQCISEVGETKKLNEKYKAIMAQLGSDLQGVSNAPQTPPTRVGEIKDQRVELLRKMLFNIEYRRKDKIAD